MSDLGNVPPGMDPGDDDDDVPGADAGPEASGRVTSGLQALYAFDEGSGAVVADSSGVGAPMDLLIADPIAVEWMPEGGVNVVAPTSLQTAGPADKVGYACSANNAITIEAWVRPAATNQNGPARVVTMSDGPQNANFMMGQEDLLSTVRLRTTDTDGNGEPSLDSDVTAFGGQIVHLAYTRSGIDDEAQTWINGQLSGTETVAGNFSTWDMTYPLTVANVAGGDRPWRGEIYLVAIYCRDLAPIEVFQNYEAGY